MGMSSWVHLDVSLIKRETAAALLLVLDNGQEVWVPKSVVSDADDYEAGDSDCTVSVAEWFAEKNDLA